MPCSAEKHELKIAVEHERSVGENTVETQSSVFPYFFRALPLPKCFTTEQSTVEALYLLNGGRKLGSLRNILAINSMLRF